MQTPTINNQIAFGNYRTIIRGNATIPHSKKNNMAIYNELGRFANLINRNNDELVRSTINFETLITGLRDKNGKFKKIIVESFIPATNKREKIRMGFKRTLEKIRTPKYIREIKVKDITKVTDYMLLDAVNRSTIGAVQSFRPIGKNIAKIKKPVGKKG